MLDDLPQLQGHRSYNAPKGARRVLDFFGMMPEGSMEDADVEAESDEESTGDRKVVPKEP